MATQKPDLTRVWANGAPSGNVVDPDITTPGKVLAGWQAEVPPFEHFNFLQKWFTQGLAHFNEQGIGIWDTDTTYPIDGMSKGSDGNVYIAITEQSGNDPTSDDGTNWFKSDIKSSTSKDSIAELIADKSVKVGDKVCTGGSQWKIISGSSNRGITLSNGLKAIPLNGLWGNDAGVIYDGLTDDTAALNLLYSYASDLERDAQGSTVATNTKPTVMHNSGRCLLTATVNTGGNLISKGQRTMFFATSGTFPLFSSSNYNTEWMGMQFDHPTGQHILFSNSTRIESSKLHIHDCEFYLCAPGKHCIETDTSVHYNYPMIATIDNIKSYGSAFARLHTNGVYISDSWIAWDTDRCTVPLLECSDPLVISNVTEVPYGSNPLRLPRIWGPQTRNLSLKCNAVRFGGEATFTPIVATDTDDNNLAQLSFEDCAMFGGAGFYWAEFYGNLPKNIKVNNAQGIDNGGFVNSLGMRVATNTDPANYEYACLTDFDDNIPAVARRMVVTDDRTGTSIPASAVPADFVFSEGKSNTDYKLINEDTGNGFSFFGAPYSTTGGASFVGIVNFLNYSFPQWRFENPNENVRVNSPTISPSQGAGIYTCALWVVAENGSGSANMGYKFDGSSNLITTGNDLIEVGLNRLVWQVYYDGTTPIEIFFNISSTASQGNTTMLLGGLTVNKGDIAGAFVPYNTSGTSGIQEVSFGTAAPTDGKWIEGSYRYNTDISSTLDGNGFYLKGWLCSSGGTPGTWQEDWARNAKWTP